MTATHPKYIDRTTTNLNACSLEVLPSTSIHNTLSHMVVGCYQLHQDDLKERERAATTTPDSTNRSGELLLYQFDTTQPTNTRWNLNNPIQRYTNTSGVLDGKWFTYTTTHSTTRAPLDSNEEGTGGNERNDGDTNDGVSCLYATACALGRIEFYRLQRGPEEDDKEEGHVQLHPIGSTQTNHDGTINTEERGLCLSLDWDKSNPLRSSSSSPSSSSDSHDPSQTIRIASSYSNGSISVHSLSHTNSFDNAYTTNGGNRIQSTETHRIDNAHTLFRVPSEVWTCCFASNGYSNTQSHVMISGGDDCHMKLWDLRLTGSKSSSSSSFSSSSSSRPVHVVGEDEHTAGVTTLSYHPTLEHIFASGSYDETLRVWDMRMLTLKRPLVRVGVGGGVWRIKWHPKEDNRVLVGAMHGGCRVVRVAGLGSSSSSSSSSVVGEEGEVTIGGDGGSGSDGEPAVVTTASVIKEFTEHESMAYGADWLYCCDGSASRNEVDGVSKTIAASCSFYDNRVFLWDASDDA